MMDDNHSNLTGLLSALRKWKSSWLNINILIFINILNNIKTQIK